MTRIYSELDLAENNVEKYMLATEQDIYLCECQYPSGREYSFRLETDIAFKNSQSIVKVYSLPIFHLFKKRGNALREKKKFEAKHGCSLRIQRDKLDSGDYVYTLKYVQQSDSKNRAVRTARIPKHRQS